MKFILEPPQTFRLKTISWIAVISALWVAILIWRGSGHATLFTKWTDNISNISTAWIFLHYGPQIYGHGIQDFTDGAAERLDYAHKWALDLPPDVFFKDRWKGDAPDYLAWPPASRPYPPGAMLIFAPFSILSYVFDLGFLIPSYLLAFVLLLAAHFGFLRFLELLPEIAKPSSAVWKVIITLFSIWLYLEMVHWALQGEYQICMAWPLIESFIRIKQQKIISAIFWFAIALFIHLHSIMYGPLIALITLSALYTGFKQKKIMQLSKLESFKLLSAATMILSALHCLYMNLVPYTTGQLSNANPWFWQNITSLQMSQWLPFGIGLGVICVIQIKTRNLIALVTFFSICCIFIMASNLGAWYSVAVIPLFLTSDFVFEKRLSFLGNIIAYVLITGTFLANSPLEFYFIRAFFSAPLG